MANKVVLKNENKVSSGLKKTIVVVIAIVGFLSSVLGIVAFATDGFDFNKEETVALSLYNAKIAQLEADKESAIEDLQSEHAVDIEQLEDDKESALLDLQSESDALVAQAFVDGKNWLPEMMTNENINGPIPRCPDFWINPNPTRQDLENNLETTIRFINPNFKFTFRVIKLFDESLDIDFYQIVRDSLDGLEIAERYVMFDSRIGLTGVHGGHCVLGLGLFGGNIERTCSDLEFNRLFALEQF